MPVIQDRSTNVTAPAQHKQSSRKGKKAWRKNVDVTEIEAGLEERNEQIIQGGVLAEKESADLFDIDVKGDSKAKASVPTRLRTLKVDEVINSRSAVPGVDSRKRPASKLSSHFSIKPVRSDWVTHKELHRLRRVADGEHTHVEVNDATFDMWDEPTGPVAKKTKLNIPESENFITEVPRAKVPVTMREAPISLAANGKAIPAVKKPTGGFSYNPSFPEYSERLDKESAKAITAEEKRLIELEADRQRAEASVRSAAEAEAAEARLEMSEWEEDSAWEGIESGVEDNSKSSKRPQRKTQAQRNKIERRKEAERKATHERMMKRKQEQLYQLKKLKKEVIAREEELAQKAADAAAAEETSASEGDDQELRRKAITKTPILEPELELVLPEELKDSLRALKPEGNLLKDRYRNLLVRGRVDARKRIPFKKQNKGKLTEKWTYKDFKI